MLTTILCSVMIVLAVFLVIAVLMQSGKDSNLSGTIAGGAETFLGKSKGKTVDRVLSKATTVVAIIFVVLVLIVYVIGAYQDNNSVDGTTELPEAMQNAVDNAADDAEGEEAADDAQASDETAGGETTVEGDATAEQPTDDAAQTGEQTGEQTETADTTAAN